MTQHDIEMTEEKAFEQDVTTMSYEELMESIRFLDAERKRLASHIHDKSTDNNYIELNEKDIKKAA